MKTFIIAASLATTAIGVLAATAPAQAYERAGYSSRHYGSATPVIDQRQARQNAEIERGRRNGTLTWREYRVLKDEQARIALQEYRAKADGRVTRDERRHLWQVQDQAARDIHAATHNSRNRWGFWFRRTGY